MGPPPPPSSGQYGGYQLPNTHQHIPNVKLPMGTDALFAAGHRGGGASLIASSPSSSNHYGYTDNHASYLETRKQKQTLLYAPTADHRIMIEFRGVMRKPGAAHAKVIGVRQFLLFLEWRRLMLSRGYVLCRR
jgi:hypothetical protein